jgi:hypothetical protein
MFRLPGTEGVSDSKTGTSKELKLFRLPCRLDLMTLIKNLKRFIQLFGTIKSKLLGIYQTQAV